jgi:hypothetical protein
VSHKHKYLYPKSLLNNRRAQVTIFIIIGLLILISVGTVIYLKGKGVADFDFLQPKTTPVEEFIDACVQSVASDAISLLGGQGGFIVLPTEITQNPSKYVSLLPGAKFDSAPKVPYWYYDGRNQIPTLEFIQLEVNNYVQQNLQKCTGNFKHFDNEFDIIERTLPFVSTVFTDKDVLIKVDWDIDVRDKGTVEYKNYKEFVSHVPVKIKRIWELANLILESENEYNHFEEMTVDYMALHPASLIPFSGVDLSCKRNVWSAIEIKETLQDELAVFMTGVRFENTDYPPFKADEKVYEEFAGITREQAYKGDLPGVPPADAYMYFHAFFNISDDDADYTDISAGASYKPDWGMKLFASPNDYGIMKSGEGDFRTEILRFLCLQLYHFTYDITYPVMISLSDPDAFHGKGFVFRYAFPVQIYHNEPDRSMLPTKFREPDNFGFDQCDTINDDREVSVIVRDSVYLNELNKVNLSYECFILNCDLGKTSPQQGKYQWKGFLPDGCGRGVVVAKAPGYLDSRKQVTSEYVDVYMHPLYNLSVKVKKHTLYSAQTGAIGAGSILAPNEYAIIQITSKDPEYSFFEKYGAIEQLNKSVIQMINNNVEYDLNIYLMTESDNAPGIIGGWQGKWNVNVGDVKDATEIVFNVVEKFPHPKTDDQLISLWEKLSNRTEYYPDINPEFN